MTPKRAFKRWMIQGTGETFRRVRVPRRRLTRSEVVSYRWRLWQAGLREGRDYTVFCLEGSSRQALLVGGI